uniref:Helix-turn-helix transcriptional regulator n=1 Tax=Streptomyces sp. NBC_01401 TaxID=2903854 RepID=A0AAU3GT95_9ACTN
MPPRKLLTVRQRRLGSELRRIREHAGLTLAQAAERLGADRTAISNTESGRFGVSPQRVRAWADHYKCPDAAYVEALAAMAAERVSGWWEHYRGELANDALDLAELEYHGAAIRSVQVMYMPGLLQTEDYARSVFAESVPPPDPARQRRQLAHRLQRRDVLDRSDRPACTFLIHEAALRMRFGGRTVVRGQLAHLLEQSTRANVTIRAIPFAAGGFPYASSSAHFVHGAVPQLDTVQVDTATGSSFLDAETSLVNWRVALDRTEERSIDPGSSRDFIRDIAQQV